MFSVLVSTRYSKVLANPRVTRLAGRSGAGPRSFSITWRVSPAATSTTAGQAGVHALAGLLYSFGFSIVFIQHPLAVSQGTRDGVTGRGHIFRRTGRGHIFRACCPKPLSGTISDLPLRVAKRYVL